MKLPTIWTVEKQRWEESEEKRSEERRVDARKDRKVAIHCVFPMICAPEGPKSRLAKAAGAEPAGQMRHEKVHAVVHEAHFQVKMDKSLEERTTFGSWDVEKVHAVVARSTFWSQNVQNTPWSVPLFGSCDVEKVTPLLARSTFGSQNVQNTPMSTTFGSSDVENVHAVVARSTFSKSKCTKHYMFAPLLEVRMLKRCTLLGAEAHFEVKSVKTGGFGAFLDIKMSKK